MRVILLAGGSGFIGYNFTKLFLNRNKNFIAVNIDKLTHAANINSMKELENSPRYHFIKGDICNYELVSYVVNKYKPDFIVNFAAEIPTEKNMIRPLSFTGTNIMGTVTLLESARNLWSRRNFRGNRFIQVSTGNVYGYSTDSKDYFIEESGLMPVNPYFASRAGADLITRSFYEAYGLPVIITRSCNTYGPYQSVEEFIPLCITSALRNMPIPVDSKYQTPKEWIHVADHCIAIIRSLFYGKPGEIYNIGSGEEITDTDLAERILKYLEQPEELANRVKNGLTYNRRCVLNSYKIRNNLSWSNKIRLDEGLKDTIEWYKNNRECWEK